MNMPYEGCCDCKVIRENEELKRQIRSMGNCMMCPVMRENNELKKQIETLKYQIELFRIKQE